MYNLAYYIHPLNENFCFLLRKNNKVESPEKFRMLSVPLASLFSDWWKFIGAGQEGFCRYSKENI